jgi:hypothetical protein
MIGKNTNRLFSALIGAALCLALAGARPTLAAGLSPEEAKAIAVDAYIYGYSLVTTEVTCADEQRARCREERAPPALFNVGLPAGHLPRRFGHQCRHPVLLAWLNRSDPRCSRTGNQGSLFTFELVDRWMIVMQRRHQHQRRAGHDPSLHSPTEGTVPEA